MEKIAVEEASLLPRMSAARHAMTEAKIKLHAAKLVRVRAEAAAGLRHAGSPDLGSTELIRKATLTGRIEADLVVIAAADKMLQAEADFLKAEALFLDAEAEFKLKVASMQE